MFSQPLSVLPLATPSVGSVSSAVSSLQSSVVSQTRRLSSSFSPVPNGRRPASKVDEKCSINEQIDVPIRELGEIARPAQATRFFRVPVARSSSTFFENKHGFPASSLGFRGYHSDVQSSITQRYAPFQPARSLTSYMHQRQLTNLEDEADGNPRVAKMQADYYRELLKADPQWVVERFESGKYSANKDCAHLYIKALERTGQKVPLVLPDVRKSRGFFSFRQASGEAKAEPEKVTRLHIPLRVLFVYVLSMAVTCGISFFFMSMAMNKYSTKAPKSIMPEDNQKLATFNDVAGVEEAKEELKHVIDFLKNPGKYQELGAVIPKGVLLVGPPGNGKTLLARAVAGEANVPFFFASAAEFEEMFVGVGASRVRKLFTEAQANSPCIIFIDELDAVGGQRSHSPNHPYARQTLNQMLVELDGFEERSGVIVIAATNAPEVLDKALTRPGRFDTLINVGLPDVRGRLAMLELHTKGMKLGRDVNLKNVARGTPMFTGAQLKNIVNQAAIKAALDNARIITQEHFDFAKDKIMMGSETRSQKKTILELRNTAYHEAGHALVGMLTPGCDPVYKATIVPRGGILGMVQSLPDEEMGMVKTKEQFKAIIAMALGGLAAEEVAFGKDRTTAGASSDLKKATNIAYEMTTRFGMSDKVGRRVVNTRTHAISQSLLETVDGEVRAVVEEGYEAARTLLLNNKAKHTALAEALLKYETLTSDEMRDVIAGKKLNRDI